jgi:hypothetical protein
MDTSTVTLGSLIDSALYELLSSGESPARTFLSATLLQAGTSFTYVGSNLIKVNDLVEIGSELMLVTGVSFTAPASTVTVSRGYYGTSAVAHSSGSAVTINPEFARRRIAEAIDRSLSTIDGLGLPLVASATLSREPGKMLIELPAGCRRVLRVLYEDINGRLVEIDHWQEYHTLPSAQSSTGKALRIPYWIQDDTELIVQYQTAYSWTGTFPSEAATLTIHTAAKHLPAAYAAAWLVNGREISRLQLDRQAEWSSTEMVRSGGASFARLQWQNFYRQLDEAKRLVALDVPRQRPLIRAPKVTGW